MLLGRGPVLGLGVQLLCGEELDLLCSAQTIACLPVQGCCSGVVWGLQSWVQPHALRCASYSAFGLQLGAAGMRIRCPGCGRRNMRAGLSVCSQQLPEVVLGAACGDINRSGCCRSASGTPHKL